ncbi:hypothetical protein D9613_007988 [Agrocybe pediades]|uniref:Uncharacterized protein n=1 Tax=Agrocybe pediades TaxID=84607 RepID=A0A8H4QN22_9AGAR|nr:hypothetical protein D9613_007988 [Agrocybe pediades]
MRSSYLFFVVSSIAYYLPVATSASVPLMKIKGMVRRSASLGNGSVPFANSSGKGNPGSSSQTGGVHSNTAGDVDPVPFECEVNIESADASLTFSPDFPNQLQFVSWVGAGDVFCDLPMTSISLTITASNTLGESSLIADAVPCDECSELDAESTNYFCQQAEFDGTCSGDWSVSYEAVIEAPVGSEFDFATGSCVPAGPILTCAESAVLGTARPYENANLPDGYVDNIQLSPTAIANIRATHFRGGAKVDSTKGLFDPTTTDAQLEDIFEKGLLSSNGWTETELLDWQKVFVYPGIVGVDNKGNITSTVTLRITRSGGVVSTMFPGSPS